MELFIESAFVVIIALLAAVMYWYYLQDAKKYQFSSLMTIMISISFVVFFIILIMLWNTRPGLIHHF